MKLLCTCSFSFIFFSFVQFIRDLEVRLKKTDKQCYCKYYYASRCNLNDCVKKLNIVPGKRPRAIAAQAPKFEGGRLHGEGFPLSPRIGPTPDAKLAAMGLNRFASSVRPCFVEAKRTDP